MSDDHQSQDTGTTPLIEDVRQKIHARGYALQDTYGERQPNAWTYTIGFTGLDHPEFVFYSLPRPAVEWITDRLHAAVKAGHTFHPGDMVDRIIHGFPLAILEVPAGYAWKVATDIYGPFTVRGLVVISPDRKSRFPWEPGSHVSDHLVPALPDEWNVYDLC